MSFGAWLLAQGHRDNDIGELARAAAADPGFPRQGGYIAVRDRVISKMADSDSWAACAAAQNEWRDAGCP